jgi:hypothetical protein
MSDDPRALLITGVFGTGKSTVAADMAGIVEARDMPYAAIDLDWMAWANTNDEHHTMLMNLASVVANYRGVGMTRFILAGTMSTREEVDGLRATLGMPLSVVRLTLPFAEIERRLATDVTEGRRDDLRRAGEALAARAGDGLGDLVVANDRPIREVATEILDWLGW